MTKKPAPKKGLGLTVIIGVGKPKGEMMAGKKMGKGMEPGMPKAKITGKKSLMAVESKEHGKKIGSMKALKAAEKKEYGGKEYSMKQMMAMEKKAHAPGNMKTMKPGKPGTGSRGRGY